MNHLPSPRSASRDNSVLVQLRIWVCFGWCELAFARYASNFATKWIASPAPCGKGRGAVLGRGRPRGRWTGVLSPRPPMQRAGRDASKTPPVAGPAFLAGSPHHGKLLTCKIHRWWGRTVCERTPDGARYARHADAASPIIRWDRWQAGCVVCGAFIRYACGLNGQDLVSDHNERNAEGSNAPFRTLLYLGIIFSREH